MLVGGMKLRYKNYRMQIGQVIAEIWPCETRDHGRPAAHTQKFPLIYERLRSLRSLRNYKSGDFNLWYS